MGGRGRGRVRGSRRGSRRGSGKEGEGEGLGNGNRNGKEVSIIFCTIYPHMCLQSYTYPVSVTASCRLYLKNQWGFFTNLLKG
jgi:hypothetical protein